MNLTIDLNNENSLFKDGIKCYEIIRYDLLKKLLVSNLLKSTFKNKITGEIYGNELEQLKAYEKKIIKKMNNDLNAVVEVTYRQSKIGFGRLAPIGSLGFISIRRDIRHTLANGTYIDIDVENAHPVMLLQICEKNGIEYNELKNYCENRDYYLKGVMEFFKVDRDEAKNLFIRLLYYGKFEMWYKCNKEKEDNLFLGNMINYEERLFKLDFKQFKKLNTNVPLIRFLDSFANNLDFIGEKIIEANEDLKNRCYNNNPDKKNKGSIISHYLQIYESKVLEVIFNYSVTKKYIKKSKNDFYDCALCHDGIMILINNILIKASKNGYKLLLDGFKNEVKDKLGFDLNFTVKEFNKSYEDILSQNIINTETTVEDNNLEVENNLLSNEVDIEVINEEQNELAQHLEVRETTLVEPVRIKTIEEQLEELKNKDGYEGVKKEFEKYNFKCNDITSYVEENLENNKLKIRNKTDFKVRYEALKYTEYSIVNNEIVNKPGCNFLKKWFEDETKRTYKNIDFIPSAKDIKPHTYNMFKGLYAETVLMNDKNLEDIYFTNMEEFIEKYIKDNKDVNILIEHIKDITGRNEEGYNYFMNSVATIIQTKEQTKIASVFQSEQGTGKDMLFKIITNYIIGKEFVAYPPSAKSVFERFNGLLENKLLCIFPETTGKDTFEYNNQIKDLINSTDYITIEKKGIDPYDLKNNINFIFFTNNDNPVKIESSDRRFVVYNPINKWVRENIDIKIKHFEELARICDPSQEKLFDELACKRVAKIMYLYWKNLDLTNFNISKRFISEGYLLMKKSQGSIINFFLIHLIEMMEIKREKEGENSKWNEYQKSALEFYTYFENWKNIAGYTEYKTNVTKFGLELKKDFPFIEKKQSNTAKYIIKYDVIKKYLIDNKYLDN